MRRLLASLQAARSLRLLAAWALLAPLIAVAQAERISLFTTEARAPERGAVGRIAAKSVLDGPASVGRSRIGEIDHQGLGRLREELVSGRPAKLRLNLLHDVEFNASLEQTALTTSGYTLSGPLEGVPFGRAILVVNERNSTGRVYTPEGGWWFRTTGDMQTVERIVPGSHRCALEGPLRKAGRGLEAPYVFPLPTEVAAAGPALAGPPFGAAGEDGGGIRTMRPLKSVDAAVFNKQPFASRGDSPAAPKANAVGSDDKVVDVLVVYPSFAREIEGGYGPMLSLIDLDIATANEAYAASGVELRLELAAAVEVEYDWFLEEALRGTSGGLLVTIQEWIDAITHLVNPEDGYLDEVHQLRDRHAADMVLLHLGGDTTARVASPLPRRSPVGGIARGISSVTTETLEELAFSVAISGDGTFVAHEIGHSMGLWHDRSNDRGNKQFPYSHGFNYVYEKPRPDLGPDAHSPYNQGTIMSVVANARLPGFVLAFSNPELSHPLIPGLKLGVPGDEPSSEVDGPADATRHLNELHSILANVRSRADADPCRYELTGGEGVLPAEGGTYRVAVDTQPGCDWSVRLGEWVSSVSNGVGAGSGEFSYRVGANDGFQRQVEVMVSGQVHGRPQAGSRAITPVCERSHFVRSRLTKMHPDFEDNSTAVGNVVFVNETPCEDLSFDPAYLASVRTLYGELENGFQGSGLRPGDFDGLTGIAELWVNRIERLPPDLFFGMTGLRILDLSQQYLWSEDGGELGSIAPDAFRGLPGLKVMLIRGHRLRQLSAGTFNGLSELVKLQMGDAQAGALRLESGAFDGLSNLRLLDMPNNGLARLEPGLFKELGALQQLNLSANQIQAWPRQTFDGLSDLRLLSVSANGIEALPTGGFEGLSRLETLFAVGNRIGRVSPGAFNGLSNLTELQLQHNQIPQLRATEFAPTPKLGVLSLSHNRLTALEPDVFAPLSELKWLYLDANRIERLEPGTFDGWSNLEFLTLEGNRIRELPRGILSGLFLNLFDVRGNPGAPFTFAPTPVAVPSSGPMAGQPEEVTVEIATAAPFWVAAWLKAPGGALSSRELIGTLSRREAVIAAGDISIPSPVLVTPEGDNPVVVMIDGPRLVPKNRYDERCDSSDLTLLGSVHTNCYLGVRLAAGPPLVLYGIEDRALTFGQGSETIDLVGVFAYFLGFAEYAAESSDGTVAAVSVEDGALTVTPGRAGTAEVTVTATAPDGETMTRRFTVAVGIPSVPLFLSDANREREGFARLVNLSERAGDVRITAVDDAGSRRGPVRLRLRANGAAHFNSGDLEGGNSAKGLAEGIGLGEGDWRLEFETDLEIEALSYVRTADGFVTSMHDAAPVEGGVSRIATFNPASNDRQASRLRVVNPGREPAQVTVRGVDDAGASRGGPVRFTVPAGAAREYDALQLEVGDAELEGALGDGEGKWRLTVEADGPVAAMSLLESTATGHLTNLSSGPQPPDADGAHHVPLMPAASGANGREGFVRVINRSGRAGTVRIAAFDDAGTAHGPLELSVEAGAAAHFNSSDLEFGNAAKGLSGSAGSPGEGDWRLELTSGLDIEVLAYVRTVDGFLTAMHGAVAVEDGRRRAAFFNPGSNTRQVSRLRLVNPLAWEAQATVQGTDDAGGSPDGVAWVTVPARGALTLSAAELEAGVPSETFGEGHWDRDPLRDGTGKWRFSVATEPEVQVMSLLESPTGHLTNLSSGGR